MKEKVSFDIAVVGGGLAGLALSIQMTRKGRSVILFEKENYPFHKVCGEYISMESWDFLQSLGVPLQQMSLPKIDSLQLTAPGGLELSTPLPLGGFGISRFKLDAILADIAKNEGVVLYEGTKVENVQNETNGFEIVYRGKEQGSITATICCAASGKKSNLDVRLKRSFLKPKYKSLDNYIGVKYHIKKSTPCNTISLHNFKDGYCGFSKVEGDIFCLCYMTTAHNLKECNSNLPQLEERILSRNPHLALLFQQSEIVSGFPITISQINFSKKSPVENGIIMLGDAGGTITPLCGNGMSMALHSSKIAACLIEFYFEGKLDKESLYREYAKKWNKQFRKRMLMGRTLQRFFGSTILTNVLLRIFKTFPFLLQPVIRKTHGHPF